MRLDGINREVSPGESELVRDFDTAESAKRFFFLTDAQFSVLATLRQTGEVVDRRSTSFQSSWNRQHAHSLLSLNAACHANTFPGP